MCVVDISGQTVKTTRRDKLVTQLLADAVDFSVVSRAIVVVFENTVAPSQFKVNEILRIRIMSAKV